MASRIAAKSTTAGTPVKSWRITLAGLKGISMELREVLCQLRMFSMSELLTFYSSQFLTAASSNTFIEYGRLLTLLSVNAERD